ncbi:putative reverse transcriptase domain-containing protein [Tanacetum coccineum]|uniref:Reverse transcriptase domain-containing protein n=1 Tax=Tanacetum coccineum TaxID=301880 RepID=A0ABQ5EFH2_9ASTR
MEIAPTTLEGVDQRVTELDTTVRQRTEEFEATSLSDLVELQHLDVITTTRGRRPRAPGCTAEAGKQQLVMHQLKCYQQDRATSNTRHHNQYPTTTDTGAQLQSLIDQGVAGCFGSTCCKQKQGRRYSHGIRNRGRRPSAFSRECTYTISLKCQPKISKALKESLALTQRSALTWWNSHVRAVGQDVAYTMPWTALKRMITDKYCPRGEIKKLESEYWNLKVRGTDLMTYNQRFQELALMCDRMFPEESAKVERYVGGLPDMIHGSVKASKPQSMQEAIEFATEMMDKKMITAAERQAENKRKIEETSRNTQNQQQPCKRKQCGDGLYTLGLEIRSLMDREREPNL